MPGGASFADEAAVAEFLATLGKGLEMGLGKNLGRMKAVPIRDLRRAFAEAEAGGGHPALEHIYLPLLRGALAAQARVCGPQRFRAPLLLRCAAARDLSRSSLLRGRGGTVGFWVSERGEGTEACEPLLPFFTLLPFPPFLPTDPGQLRAREAMEWSLGPREGVLARGACEA